MSAKDQLKRFIASQPLLEKSMFYAYRWQKGNAVDAEIERRRKIDLFDIEQLSQDIAFGPEERVIDNNLYGYASYLKKYAGIKSDLKAYMEHGLFLGGIVHPDQFHWHFPKIITLSEQRREILAAKIPGKESLAVGPYIHYATSLLEAEEQAKLKARLGKTLLVYPFHSMKNVKAGFNDQELINEIKRVAKDFDSVLICLYYLDARDPVKVAAYRAEGFHLVTAGHRFDRHFIARQRSHIELANLTMSNGMGTQTGFCVYLNKPHYIYQQHIDQKASSLKELKRFEAGGSAGSVKERVAAERAYFSQLFSELRMDISAEQRAVTADYWGFESVQEAAFLQNYFSA
ncbi:hypothetical protein [Croceimicrobium sp.]|uniref:hypothetical protein n=1 Tax=Croceimicrobium sp. TaxID=2828340 RepID=UPI003BA87CF7